MLRRIATTTALLALATFAFAACSTSPSLSSGSTQPSVSANATPAAVPSVNVSPTGDVTTMTFKSPLASLAKNLHTAGPHDEITYGWNNLVGPANINGDPARVDLQGSVWYVTGTGPWSGFFTITFSDGSTLGLNVLEASATKDPTGVTAFAGRLVVIGGTGRWVNATGSGSLTGSRAGAIGSPIVLDFALDVHA